MTRAFTITVLLAVSVLTTDVSAQNTQTRTRTVTETVQEQVRFYNQRTGRYETRTVYREVPVEVQEEVPVGLAPSKAFLVNFVNRFSYPVTVTIGGRQARLQPGGGAQTQAFEGQRFSYVGPPTRTSRGTMLGGVACTASSPRESVS